MVFYKKLKFPVVTTLVLVGVVGLRRLVRSYQNQNSYSDATMFNSFFESKSEPNWEIRIQILVGFEAKCNMYSILPQPIRPQISSSFWKNYRIFIAEKVTALVRFSLQTNRYAAISPRNHTSNIYFGQNNFVLLVLSFCFRTQ